MEPNFVSSEIIASRDIMHPLFETTGISSHYIPANTSPTACFYDGFPCNSFFLYKTIAFCSPSCALAHFPCKEHPDIQIRAGKYVQTAPQRYTLAVYGGTMSIAQYRSIVSGDVPENPAICQDSTWCMHDCHEIPQHAAPVKHADLGSMCFCSDNCLLAYVIDFLLPGGKLETELRMQLNRKNGSSQVFPAPQKKILTKFGGTHSIDDYRKMPGEAFVFFLPESHILPPNSHDFRCKDIHPASYYIQLKFNEIAFSTKPPTGHSPSNQDSLRANSAPFISKKTDPCTNLKGVRNNLPFFRRNCEISKKK